jgi:hypothetical protein
MNALIRRLWRLICGFQAVVGVLRPFKAESVHSARQQAT